jgi:hypothetical protein
MAALPVSGLSRPGVVGPPMMVDGRTIDFANTLNGRAMPVMMGIQ